MNNKISENTKEILDVISIPYDTKDEERLIRNITKILEDIVNNENNKN